MSNDYEIKKPQDLSKINTNNMGEVLWWSYQFGVTIEKLLTSVQKHGVEVKEISKYLRKARED